MLGDADARQVLATRLAMRDFLDASECAELVRRINDLRDRWTRRSAAYFTLGTVSYLDAGESRDSYLAAAARTNPLLSNSFEDLYDGLRNFLEQLLDEPVGYGKELALPGFHIFEFYGGSSQSPAGQKSQGPNPAEESAAERVHFDLQFRQVVPDWKPEATLSFTLPVAQPTGGAGLAVWPLDCDEAVRRNMSHAGLRDFAAKSPYERVDYETGRILLHDGFLLHSILHTVGDTTDSAPGGQRITLQGHGVRHNGRWTFFW
jgi:hypothetical protein